LVRVYGNRLVVLLSTTSHGIAEELSRKASALLKQESEEGAPPENPSPAISTEHITC
jgi:hypothetical protein